MIRVYDNILSQEHEDYFFKTILESQFPWVYTRDITNRKTAENPRPAFSHVYYRPTNFSTSNYSFLVDKIADEGLKLLGKKGSVIQARSFLQLPLKDNFDTYDSPHIDLTYDHIVFLYYVCDSDGDTVLFEKNQQINDLTKYDLKIKKQVTPKKGRLLIFDGSYWHTAYQPKENVRCVINININIT